GPLFILRYLGHLRRQLLKRRPLTIQLVGSQPLLTDGEIINDPALVVEQWPLCVNHELQIRVRNYRIAWRPIYAQQNQWLIADKNLWWIVVQLHTGRWRVLWRRRD